MPLIARNKSLPWRRARVCVLLLAEWELLAWGGARALLVNAEVSRADALVVLSGSTSYVERARWAAQLFHAGRAPRVVLTNDDQRGGWSNAERRNPYFVERAAEELRRTGVPAERNEVLPRAVTGTHDEAVLLREYAGAKGARSLLVVTSAYHSRRALWTLRRAFRESGVEVGLSAVPVGGSQTPAPATWWLSARLANGSGRVFEVYLLLATLPLSQKFSTDAKFKRNNGRHSDRRRKNGGGGGDRPTRAGGCAGRALRVWQELGQVSGIAKRTAHRRG
ncbi:MAG: YdcF family protein [Pyrinomonadaceae bacterium]